MQEAISKRQEARGKRPAREKNKNDRKEESSTPDMQDWSNVLA